MSTRFYPRFVKGNPQLRVFLPDWKMVMVKTKDTLPSNVVSFKVDPRMTDWDVKNYLEKIYKVTVASVDSKIFSGPIKRTTEGLAKGEDYRIAHITLPIGQSFEWPDLFPKKKREEQKEDFKMLKREIEKLGTVDSNAKIPKWFT